MSNGSSYSKVHIELGWQLPLDSCPIAMVYCRTPASHYCSLDSLGARSRLRPRSKQSPLFFLHRTVSGSPGAARGRKKNDINPPRRKRDGRAWWFNYQSATQSNRNIHSGPFVGFARERDLAARGTNPPLWRPKLSYAFARAF